MEAPIDADVRIRRARRGEEKALAEVAQRTFRERPRELWERYYRRSPHRGPGDVAVCEVGGVLAGHASVLRFEMSLCGRDVPMHGVAAVAVAPELRRRGLADRLMRELLAGMRKERVPLSLLYAFRLPFYRKLGYETAELWDHLRVAPRQLPASPLRRHIRRMDPVRDRRVVEVLYEGARAGTTGQLVRTPWWWEMRVFARAEEGVLYQGPGDDAPTGYLLYTPARGPVVNELHVVVHEMRWATPEAARGLFGFLESLRDQVSVVETYVPRGHAAHLVSDYGLPEIDDRLRLDLIALTRVAGMARADDVKATMSVHPAPRRNGAEGTVGLDVEDPVFPDQTGSFDLSFSPRGTRLTSGRKSRVRLSLSIQRLSQIVLGTTRAATLLSQGFVAGHPRAADLLDRAFAGPTLHLGPLNSF